MPLGILGRAWKSIYMNFHGDLTKTKREYDQWLVLEFINSIVTFEQCFEKNMCTKLKRFTTSHPQG